MLGLPAHPGTHGALFLLLGIVCAAALAPAVWRTMRRATGPGGRWVAVLLSASLLSSLAAVPFLAWRIVQDIRYTSGITAAQAARIGGDMAGLDRRAFDWLEAGIPPGDTFAVDAPGGSGDFDTGQKVGWWAGYRLLPRILVLDPAAADWVVGWGRQPTAHGARLGTVRVLRLPGADPGVYYLARVLR